MQLGRPHLASLPATVTLTGMKEFAFLPNIIQTSAKKLIIKVSFFGKEVGCNIANPLIILNFIAVNSK
jgi:hypothetical protein